MRNLTDVALAVRKGSHSSERLEEFLEGMEALYSGMNMLDLVLNYYENFLFFHEEGVSEEGGELFRRMNLLIEKVILNREEPFFEKEEVLSFRKEIEDRTEGVSIFQSAFWNFRYALRRRFSENNLEIRDRDEIAKEILEFIFKDEDSMLINHRITDVLSCLPIRYTRGKFLELVENAIDRYQDADKQSLERFLYGIKHAGMLSLTEEVKNLFPRFSSELSHFRELEISKLSEEEVKTEMSRIERDLEDCEEILEESLRLINTVNKFYLPTHVRLRKEQNFKIEEECISLIHEYFLNEDSFGEEQEEYLDSLFESLEGKIEELYEKKEIPADVLLELEQICGDRLKEYGFLERYKVLKYCDFLLKSSFVSFEEIEQSEEGISKEEQKKIKQSFLNELEEKFKEVKLPVRRAIMAQILGNLPVYFENRTEVMNYVREALSTCDNEEELKASVWEFYSIRSEDD